MLWEEISNNCEHNENERRFAMFVKIQLLFLQMSRLSKSERCEYVNNDEYYGLRFAIFTII